MDRRDEVSDASHGSGSATDPTVRAAAAKAIELISDGMRVGLGSGRAVSAFIEQLGQLEREGVQTTCVCASSISTREAHSAGLTVVELAEVGTLDLTVDGADEVAPNLDLLKGRGGAMVRERIVAAAAERLIIIVGDEKLVGALGERGAIPVEVIPMAEEYVTRMASSLGLTAQLRLDTSGSQSFVSDNGNIIIDCAPATPLSSAKAREMERALLDIPGVVDTGLFLGLADIVLIGRRNGQVEERLRQEPSR